MEQKHSLTGFAAVLAIASALMIVLVGCESDDDDETTSADLAIDPSSITLDVSSTATVTFTASGGATGYVWSVKDTCLGSLADSGDTAVYTSTTNTGNNYVTVTDASNNVVTATIVQE